MPPSAARHGRVGSQPTGVTTIHQDRHGATLFTIDQPSTRFSSFDIPDIAAVGEELDRKVVNLLKVLDVTVPPALSAAAGGDR